MNLFNTFYSILCGSINRVSATTFAQKICVLDEHCSSVTNVFKSVDIWSSLGFCFLLFFTLTHLKVTI